MIQTYPLSCFLEKLVPYRLFSINNAKRKNKQDPSKPWLTPGIIKSIRIKNNWGHLDIPTCDSPTYYGPTECINNPTFRVDSSTKPILAVFSSTNR